MFPDPRALNANCSQFPEISNWVKILFSSHSAKQNGSLFFTKLKFYDFSGLENQYVNSITFQISHESKPSPSSPPPCLPPVLPSPLPSFTSASDPKQLIKLAANFCGAYKTARNKMSTKTRLVSRHSVVANDIANSCKSVFSISPKH